MNSFSDILCAVHTGEPINMRLAVIVGIRPIYVAAADRTCPVCVVNERHTQNKCTVKLHCHVSQQLHIYSPYSGLQKHCTLLTSRSGCVKVRVRVRKALVILDEASPCGRVWPGHSSVGVARRVAQ